MVQKPTTGMVGELKTREKSPTVMHGGGLERFHQFHGILFQAKDDNCRPIQHGLGPRSQRPSFYNWQLYGRKRKAIPIGKSTTHSSVKTTMTTWGATTTVRAILVVTRKDAQLFCQARQTTCIGNIADGTGRVFFEDRRSPGEISSAMPNGNILPRHSPLSKRRNPSRHRV